jgi:spoIIIJ-associated protein
LTTNRYFTYFTIIIAYYMKEEFEQQLYEILKLLVEPIAANPIITVVREGDQWRVTINSDQNDLLVGYKGENIKAIQHITRVVIHKKFPDDRTHFLIDIGEYKRSREHVITGKITNLAEKEVLELGKTLILTGLTGYERKIVHSLLADIAGLETTSVGESDNRKLLIRPTSGDLSGSTGMDSAMVINLNKLEKEDLITKDEEIIEES